MADDESLHPTADHVEDFLQQSKDKPSESAIDPEMAKQMAKELFQQEEKLDSAMQQYPRKENIGPDQVILDPDTKLFRFKSMSRLSCNRAPFSGLGTKRLSFSRDVENLLYLTETDDETAPGTFLDFQPKYYLFLGIHTDLTTQTQAEEHVAKHPDKARQLGTYYLFDDDGNHKKFVMAPGEIKDHRPTTIPFPANNQRFIVADMTASDFELAGMALSLLQKKLE